MIPKGKVRKLIKVEKTVDEWDSFAVLLKLSSGSDYSKLNLHQVADLCEVGLSEMLVCKQNPGKKGKDGNNILNERAESHIPNKVLAELPAGVNFYR